MKKKDKWFNNNKGCGYIKYKGNGKVSIYLSVGGVLKEIELNQSK
jgi:cold shock CspA family protein